VHTLYEFCNHAAMSDNISVSLLFVSSNPGLSTRVTLQPRTTQPIVSISCVPIPAVSLKTPFILNYYFHLHESSPWPVLSFVAASPVSLLISVVFPVPVIPNTAIKTPFEVPISRATAATDRLIPFLLRIGIVVYTRNGLRLWLPRELRNGMSLYVA
jgi:hypothetical protein